MLVFWTMITVIFMIIDELRFGKIMAII